MPWTAVTASRPLGSQRPDAVAAAGAPARQPGRHPVGAPEQLGIGERAAALVLHGRMARPPGGGVLEKSAEVASVHGRRPCPARWIRIRYRGGRDLAHWSYRVSRGVVVRSMTPSGRVATGSRAAAVGPGAGCRPGGAAVREEASRERRVGGDRPGQRLRNSRSWPVALGWSSQAAISSVAGSSGSKVSERSKVGDGVVGRQGLQPRHRLGPDARGRPPDPTRGMITIASGTPAERHSAAIAPRVRS